MNPLAAAVIAEVEAAGQEVLLGMAVDGEPVSRVERDAFDAGLMVGATAAVTALTKAGRIKMGPLSDDRYYRPNHPAAPDPAQLDRMCPDDCEDTTFCGCGCGELVCINHQADEYEVCERVDVVLVDHHGRACKDPVCLGAVDPDPDWGDETWAPV